MDGITGDGGLGADQQPQAQNTTQQPQQGGQRHVGQQLQQQQQHLGGLQYSQHQSSAATTQQQYGMSGQSSHIGQYAAAAQDRNPRSVNPPSLFPSAGQQQPQNSMSQRDFSPVSAQSPGSALQPARSPSSMLNPLAAIHAARHPSAQQYLQVPTANRIPSGESSTSYASSDGSGSFVQQYLPRHRAQGGQQQDNQDSQQHLPPASQHGAASQQSQFLPSRNISNQQFSPTAAQFQPGAQQHSMGGGATASSQNAEVARQVSTGTQIISPDAPHFQPGAQQHLTNSQQNPNGVQRFGVGQQPTGGACQFLDTLDDDGDETMKDAGQAAAEHEALRKQALDRAQQWVGQTSVGEAHVGSVQTPEGVVEDPLYHETLRQVQEWQAQQNFSMTEDQQTRLATQETWRKKDNIKGGKRLAEMDDSDIDEEDVAEAGRNAKRPRTGSHGRARFWASAHKVYVMGPENNPLRDEDEMLPDAQEVDGVDVDAEIIGRPAQFVGKSSGLAFNFGVSQEKPYQHKIFDPNFRLMESICCDWEFMVEVTKHLSVKDLIMLYSVSKTFHDLVNKRFQSTVAAWAQQMSPAGYKIFFYKFYGDLCIQDPAGTDWANPGPVSIPRAPWARPQRAISRSKEVRAVPGFRWLAMVSQRETRTRDIIACLARSGHRLPETMHLTLKKMWVLMDAPTNRLRRAIIHNKDMWTNRDLYNAHMFYIKLQLRFNEPILGPKCTALADTILGLRDGLNLLWGILRHKAFLTPQDAIRMRLRYFCRQSIVQHHLLVGAPCHGVPPHELVNEHLEGWGAGKIHLSRPDELVIEEVTRRHGRLEKHTLFMLFWGHVDWRRRANLVPTEDEMYMSDDDLAPLPRHNAANDIAGYVVGGVWGRCGNVPFDGDNWQPKHAMKARWATLTDAEKRAILRDDKEERKRILPYERLDESFWELPYNSNDMPHPDYPNGEPSSDSYEDDYSDDDEQMGGVDGDANSEKVHVKKEEGVQYEDEKPLKMPKTVEDPDTVANWDTMDPFLQQLIIDEEARLHKQDAKDDRTLAVEYKKEQDELQRRASSSRQSSGQSSGDAGAASASSAGLSPPSPYISPMKKKPQRYRYPSVTDPVSLALLEKYDRFAPEEFGEGKIDEPAAEEVPAAESSSSGFEDWEDEDLKALGDLDYDSEDVDLDMRRYQKFLKRIEEDGEVKKSKGGAEDAGKGEEKKVQGKKDVKGKGKAVAVESSSSSDEEDDDYSMAHEEDLNDENPLVKYDFRKF